MVKIFIKKSTRKNKKYMLIGELDGRKKTVHFGAKGMSDYTIHKDPERKERYIKRHQKREAKFWTPHNKKNLFTPSYLTRYLLWGPHTSLAKNKKFIEDKQNLNIK